MKKALKPCPFCKAEDPVVMVRGVEDGYCVVCSECYLMFGYEEDYGGLFDSPDEAIEAWNRREA